MAKTSTQKLSFNLAFCGIISAICVIIMFGSLIPSLAYVVPAITGLFIWTISEQVGLKWAYLSYAAVAFLSFILVPEIEANCFLLSLFGYYPTVCENLKTIKNGFLRYLLKLAIFNISAVATFKVLCFILSAEKMLEGLEEYGEYGVYIFWGLGLFAFILYDLYLIPAKQVYIKLIKPKFNKLVK